MTYYGPKEMAASFRTVRNNTIKIAEEIPEENYGFRSAEGCRSVAEQLVHIAVAVRIQEQINLVQKLSTLVGFDFFALMGQIIAEEQKPRTKAQILEMLRTEGEKYASALEGLSEDDAAKVLDVDAPTLRDLVEESGRELAAEIATDVLIIEDETFIALDLEGLVESLGHRVLGVARTHSEAVALA